MLIDYFFLVDAKLSCEILDFRVSNEYSTQVDMKLDNCTERLSSLEVLTKPTLTKCFLQVLTTCQ